MFAVKVFVKDIGVSMRLILNNPTLANIVSQTRRGISFF